MIAFYQFEHYNQAREFCSFLIDLSTHVYTSNINFKYKRIAGGRSQITVEAPEHFIYNNIYNFIHYTLGL